MKILLIGFRYLEIEQIQDRLLKEIPHMHIDFAISVRDSWYRSNLAPCDFIVIDMSDSDANAKEIIHDIADKSNGADLICLAIEKDVRKLSELKMAKPFKYLVKDPNYLERLIGAIKAKNHQMTHSKDHSNFALQELETKAPYLLPTIHAAFEPIVIINKKLEIAAMNDAFLEQFQLSGNHVLGRPCCEVLGRYFASCGKQGANCAVHQVIRHGTQCQLTMEGNDLPGKFAVRASPIRNQQNEIEYAIVTLQKSTASQTGVSQPLFNKSLLEQLLSGLSDGVLFCNAEHQIMFSNLAAESIIGLKKMELLNRSILELPLGNGIEWLDEGLNSLKAGIRFNSIAFNALIGDQKVQVRFAPIFGQGECYLGGFLYLTEVEEFLPIEKSPDVQHLTDQNFDVLRLSSPRVIAEG